MLYVRWMVALVVFACLAVPLRADDEISARALKRAHAFLKLEKRAREVLTAVHFGCKYDGHTYAGHVKVKNKRGKVIPGHFALLYDYTWADDGETRLAFLCDARGNFYELQVVKTNAVFAQPFVFANASIKLLGEALLEAFKDDIKEADRKVLRKLIDDADAKAMVEWSLKFQQALAD